MSADGQDGDRVDLDLVPVELIAPRLRKVAIGSVVVGVVLALIASFFLPVVVAVVLGVVVAVPTAGSAWVGLRRRTWLTGSVIRARGAVRTRALEVPKLVSAEVQVRTARIDQISLRLYDGRTRITVPLALYTKGGGRELPILSLRKLADALWTSELVPAAAIASVLVDQLKAEARDAGLDERPLFRAVELVREAGRTPIATLTDREVAELTA
ncbi:hypothetical protein [Rhodococcoides kyotonense]|uniref:Uncharacterized protein n=1 Tax=Rhodococcoides kyotonense TaxID=398843 RepID=A0A239CVK1_9NOCA|nr:hypothetical protein [Rhodococcus kyotonensis]SNS23564.1 hypothetical protein SAMN05421642_101202 [Rhodococcus kyotonensis]